MEARRTGWCYLLATSLTLCGCVTPDPSVDLLEGELRWMEDQLYMMEDQLEQRCNELVACREAKDGGPCNSVRTGAPTPADRYSEPSPTNREPDQDRTVPELLDSPNDSTPTDKPASLPPQIDLGNEAPEDTDASALDTEFDLDNISDEFLEEPDIVLPAPEPKPARSRPELEKPSTDSADSETPLFFRENVVRLHLNAARVSSHDIGGDQEKLLIVIEPRAKSNAYIELSAPVEILLEDASKVGEDARLSTWEFDALETGRTFRKSDMGQGIHLALDWPQDVPLVDDLRVVVAYRRLDGKQVHAEKILHPKVQVTSVAGWVPVARSHDETTTATQIPNPPPAVSDPFALTEQGEPAQARTMFQTVPIPTGMANVHDTNAKASWTEPIGKGTRTPTANMDPKSIGARMFGDATNDAAENEPRTFVEPREAVPLLAAAPEEEVPTEERPAKETPTEAEISTGPTWTPYR